MANKVIKVPINAELQVIDKNSASVISKLKQGLQDLTAPKGSAFNGLTKSIEDYQKALTKLATTQLTSNNVETYAKAIQTLKIKEEELQNAVNKATNELNSQQNAVKTDAVTKAEDTLKNLAKTYKTTAEDIKKMNAAQLRARGKELGFETSDDDVKARAEAARVLTNYTNRLNKLKLSQQQEEHLLKIINDLLKTNSDAGQKAADTQDKLNKEVAEWEQQSAANQIKDKVKYYTSFAFSVQVVREQLRKMLQTYKDVDAALTNISMVSGISRQEMWANVGTFNDLARELGTTTNEALEASKLYYQQGLKTNEVLVLTEQSLKLAAIAETDAKTATNYLTTAINGFKLSAEEAAMVTDTWAELAGKTAVDVEELAVGISKVASIAQSAGMELQSTSAFLTQIIETTREAPETAGTALKTIIARFQELKTAPGALEDGVDANKVEAALKTAGVALRDATGQFRDFDDVIVELSSKWDGLDRNTQRYIATIAAGSRQQSRFIALVDDYDGLLENMSYAYDSAGASSEQFNTYNQGLSASLDRLTASWEGLYLSFEQGGTIVSWVVELLSGLLDAGAKIGLLPTGILTAFLAQLAKAGVTFVSTAIATNSFAEANNKLRSSLSGLRKALDLAAKGGEAVLQLTKKLSFKYDDLKKGVDLYNEVLKRTNSVETATKALKGKLIKLGYSEAAVEKLINTIKTKQIAIETVLNILKAKEVLATLAVVAVIALLAVGIRALIKLRNKELNQSIEQANQYHAAAEAIREQNQAMNEAVDAYKEAITSGENLDQSLEALQEAYVNLGGDVRNLTGDYREQLEIVRELQRLKLQESFEKDQSSWNALSTVADIGETRLKNWGFGRRAGGVFGKDNVTDKSDIIYTGQYGGLVEKINLWARDQEKYSEQLDTIAKMFSFSSTDRLIKQVQNGNFNPARRLANYGGSTGLVQEQLASLGINISWTGYTVEHNGVYTSYDTMEEAYAAVSSDEDIKSIVRTNEERAKILKDTALENYELEFGEKFKISGISDPNSLLAEYFGSLDPESVSYDELTGTLDTVTQDVAKLFGAASTDIEEELATQFLQGQTNKFNSENFDVVERLLANAGLESGVLAQKLAAERTDFNTRLDGFGEEIRGTVENWNYGLVNSFSELQLNLGLDESASVMMAEIVDSMNNGVEGGLNSLDMDSVFAAFAQEVYDGMDEISDVEDAFLAWFTINEDEVVDSSRAFLEGLLTDYGSFVNELNALVNDGVATQDELRYQLELVTDGLEGVNIEGIMARATWDSLNQTWTLSAEDAAKLAQSQYEVTKQSLEEGKAAAILAKETFKSRYEMQQKYGDLTLLEKAYVSTGNKGGFLAKAIGWISYQLNADKNAFPTYESYINSLGLTFENATTDLDALGETISATDYADKIAEYDKVIADYNVSLQNLKPPSAADFQKGGGGSSKAVDANKEYLESLKAVAEAQKEAAKSAEDAAKAEIKAIQAALTKQKELLKEKLDAEKDAFDKEQELAKLALEHVKDTLEKQREEYEKAAEEAQERATKELDLARKAADLRIEAIQAQIDAIDEEADAENRLLELQKARDEYERARTSKTRLVLTKGAGWIFKTDNAQVADAATNLKEAERDYQKSLLEEQIAEIEEANRLLDILAEYNGMSFEEIRELSERLAYYGNQLVNQDFESFVGQFGTVNTDPETGQNTVTFAGDLAESINKTSALEEWNKVNGPKLDLVNEQIERVSQTAEELLRNTAEWQEQLDKYYELWSSDPDTAIAGIDEFINTQTVRAENIEKFNTEIESIEQTISDWDEVIELLGLSTEEIKAASELAAKYDSLTWDQMQKDSELYKKMYAQVEDIAELFSLANEKEEFYESEQNRLEGKGAISGVKTVDVGISQNAIDAIIASKKMTEEEIDAYKKEIEHLNFLFASAKPEEDALKMIQKQKAVQLIEAAAIEIDQIIGKTDYLNKLTQLANQKATELRGDTYNFGTVNIDSDANSIEQLVTDIRRYSPLIKR